MNNAKWCQKSEDKSVHSFFEVFTVKFNVELSCSDKAIYYKIKKTIKKIFKLRKSKDKMWEMMKKFSKLQLMRQI